MGADVEGHPMTSVKGEGYYANERPDVVAALPRPLGRVLDVGCGAGGMARGLRAAGASELVGIEIVPDAAARAADVLDRVIVGPVESRLMELDGEFDTILCLDVLEHLANPAEVLSELRRYAREGAHLQVSVPNARHYSLVRDLVLHGTFGYSDWGHRDNTHLRWFTRRDIIDLVRASGWQLTGTSWPPLGRSALLHRVSGGRSSEFLVAQVYASARNPG
jgi:2-polyprenyl-3-methyl-5-hydroxy-6-metoxy-1,4-benzoquinol methylase